MLLRLLAARWLVDPVFYLDRYPDVRAAGVDPIRHFAECGYAIPIRAPNPFMERAIIRVSPLLALAVSVLHLQRDDWLQCFVERYIDLSCGDLGFEYRFARWVMRRIAVRGQDLTEDDRAAQKRIIGRRLPVARIVDRAHDWISLKDLDPPRTHRFTSPRLWNARRPVVQRAVSLPGLWCADVRGARVFGSMQVVANGHFLAYEPAADPRLSFTAGQYRHIITCFADHENMVLARMPEGPRLQVDEAILLGGRCSNNYFHFLIEYLSKGYVIERADLPASVPLIISDDLFPAQIEAVELLFSGRQVLRLPVSRTLDVGRLHIPSLMTYLPDALEVTDWKKEGLRRENLDWLRTRVFSVLAGEADDDRPAPSRIYLARSRGRNILNATAVASVFRDHGFTIVDPSGLPFRDQVRMFAAASHIAGPVGAAFSNIVFCRPGTAILGLGSRHGLTSSLYQNLAEVMDCDCTHLVSDKRLRDRLYLRKNIISLRQGSYTINIDQLDRLLRAWSPMDASGSDARVPSSSHSTTRS